MPEPPLAHLRPPGDSPHRQPVRSWLRSLSDPTETGWILPVLCAQPIHQSFPFISEQKSPNPCWSLYPVLWGLALYPPLCCSILHFSHSFLFGSPLLWRMEEFLLSFTSRRTLTQWHSQTTQESGRTQESSQPVGHDPFSISLSPGKLSTERFIPAAKLQL